MAEHPIYVSIKIKPYLADYIRHYYGEDPIKADMKSKLFPFLSEFLTHAPPNYRPLPDGPGVITFELPYNYILDIRGYNYISPDDFPRIQSFFYGLFYNHFIQYMNERCMIDQMPFKSAIIVFMEENNLSWDRFQYDSLKRIYFRYRKKIRPRPKK